MIRGAWLPDLSPQMAPTKCQPWDQSQGIQGKQLNPERDWAGQVVDDQPQDHDQGVAQTGAEGPEHEDVSREEQSSGPG